MPITEEQRLARIGKANASAIGRLVGVDPRGNMADEVALATGRIGPSKTTGAMDAGTWFEGPVLDRASERYPIVARNVHLEVPELNLSANLDALAYGGIPIEAKTCGLFGPVSENWGEEGTDDVPYRVICQVHAQMRCVPNHGDHAVVAAFVAGRGFVDFIVPWSDEVWGICEDAIARFSAYVATNTMPPSLTPSMATLKALKRTPKSIVAVNPQLLWQYQESVRLAKIGADDKAAAQAALLSALGDAEAGDCGKVGTFTYMSEKRRAYSVAESEHRTLRIKKTKESTP
jgi:hypothetical protein